MTRTRRRRRLLAALTTVLLLGALASCGQQDPDRPAQGLADRIRVTGAFGEQPELEVGAPLEVGETSSWTEVRGTGDRVAEGGTALLQLTMVDGRTGRTAISTFDRGQRPLEVEMGEQVFPSLVTALVGTRAGSRVVVASTPEDAYGEGGAPQLGIRAGDPVVMVADVLSTDPTSLSTQPSGTIRPLPRSAPRPVLSDAVPTRIDVRGQRRPRTPSVVLLADGTGPRVGSPDRVTVDYLGQVWGAARPFEESYSKEPTVVTVGMGSVVRCWDRGLRGLREGARVLLVCPPGLAYGAAAQPGIPPRSTLVFLIDVRGVG